MSDGTEDALPGWFEVDANGAHLVGSVCKSCGTYYFPAQSTLCRNPACGGTDIETTRLSQRGKVWSYTDAHYAIPAPYVAADPFEPFALAVVELEKEQMVVFGQLDKGLTVNDIEIGTEVELTTGVLCVEEGVEKTIWKWKLAEGDAS